MPRRSVAVGATTRAPKPTAQRSSIWVVNRLEEGVAEAGHTVAERVVGCNGIVDDERKLGQQTKFPTGIYIDLALGAQGRNLGIDSLDRSLRGAATGRCVVLETKIEARHGASKIFAIVIGVLCWAAMAERDVMGRLVAVSNSAVTNARPNLGELKSLRRIDWARLPPGFLQMIRQSE